MAKNYLKNLDWKARMMEIGMTPELLDSVRGQELSILKNKANFSEKQVKTADLLARLSWDEVSEIYAIVYGDDSQQWLKKWIDSGFLPGATLRQRGGRNVAERN
jgi:hypothetical protein